MVKLTEAGLLKNDLDHLVLPLIEIDAFESKIDNARAIVVAFYVFEQEPAKDLEHFIEKSEVTIMDSETSPAPTEDGYYVVFVELARDQNFPEHLMRIIDDVDNLTNIDQWQFKVLSTNELLELSIGNLREFVNLDPESIPPDQEDELEDIKDVQEPEGPTEEEPGEEPQEEPEEEELAEMLKPILKMGLMESVNLNNNQLSLIAPGVNLSYTIVYADTEQPSLPILAHPIGHSLINASAKLERILGPAYVVETVEDGLLVNSANGYLILQPLD